MHSEKDLHEKMQSPQKKSRKETVSNTKDQLTTKSKGNQPFPSLLITAWPTQSHQPSHWRQ